MPTPRRSKPYFAVMVFAGVVGMLELGKPVIHAQLLDATGQPEAQAERLKTLTSRLQPISPEQGGGYSIDAELSGFQDADYVDVVKIPGIRVYDDRDGSGPRDLSLIGQMTQLEGLGLYHDFVTNESLRGLSNLKQLEVLTLSTTVHRWVAPP